MFASEPITQGDARILPLARRQRSASPLSPHTTPDRAILVLCASSHLIRLGIAAVILASAGPLAAATPAADAAVDGQVASARRETGILAAYRMSPELRGYDINVLVAGDSAALTGVVDSEDARLLAGRIALATNGIARVDNRITIDALARPRSDTGSGSGVDARAADDAISAAIESKLQWNALTDGLDVRVATHAGRVTLAGSAISYAERDMAGIVANDTDGVVGVSNELTLAAGARTDRHAGGPADPPSDAWISSRVKSSLLFTRGVSRFAISVATRHGVVSLAGVVASKADRDLVLQVAQDVRGVRQVDAEGLTIG